MQSGGPAAGQCRKNNAQLAEENEARTRLESCFGTDVAQMIECCVGTEVAQVILKAIVSSSVESASKPQQVAMQHEAVESASNTQVKELRTKLKLQEGIAAHEVVQLKLRLGQAEQQLVAEREANAALQERLCTEHATWDEQLQSACK